MGGGGTGVSVKPSKLIEMRHYSTLDWPQYPGNPISEKLNFKNFRDWMPPTALRCISGLSLKSCIRPWIYVEISPVHYVCLQEGLILSSQIKQ